MRFVLDLNLQYVVDKAKIAKRFRGLGLNFVLRSCSFYGDGFSVFVSVDKDRRYLIQVFTNGKKKSNSFEFDSASEAAVGFVDLVRTYSRLVIEWRLYEFSEGG